MTPAQIGRRYVLFAICFALYIGLLALAEGAGAPAHWIGFAVMLASIVMYAAIGVFSRTADVTEYYVAGRRIPAIFNGMATAADWMSAASFLGMAGTLYFAGYDGLAFVMGWTGGFVLVSLLLAPYLRRFGQFTIPDFLGERYEGRLPRLIGVCAVVVASFVYVVAQIYGVGLITSRFANIEFEIGVFVGLAGVLVCSFLGGMRAVTWTQVAQYIVIIAAYLTPVVILSWKVTGVPVPQVMYGQVLQRLDAVETRLLADPAEAEVREALIRRAEQYQVRIAALPESLLQERATLVARISALQQANAPARDVAQAQRQLRALPPDPEAARVQWDREYREALLRSEPPHRHAEAFPSTALQSSEHARNNFIALVFVLMIGTAGLPHVLMRYYTTPGVADTRRSVFWSLLFIFLLYITAPAYAVFAKWEIYSNVVGSAISSLPSWLFSWGKVGLIAVEDVNLDGILQLAELSLNPDVIVLATPEIAGLPYVVSGLVAAGGLAAALSTADGLLLTISSALSHDVYYHVINPRATTSRRLLVSKGTLMVVAVIAAWVASLRPDSILFTVGFAFSLAGAAFFPALVCGIFWRRANKWGAVAGMLAGLLGTLAYAVRTHSFFGGSMDNAWLGIQPISSGVFGVCAGFVVLVAVSLLTAAPGRHAGEVLAEVRSPAKP
ncbi:VC_2705 family sodium/solute symporter [Uliginosibacterium sp. H1]|uniref:VC_2705 family sodium/solute symporter n=1 Tax=Uliginosibacterium sp. H1 TaxID=3114757 RepID=UPI002E1718F1|nr:VC_2705 family sodium/solute symporter [Uliginosibacterium sp. H1]